MGVDSLWQLIEPSSTSITLDVLEGKRLAIDISIWLHQARHGYQNCSQTQRSKHPHLMLLINRIAKLLFYKIRPVFVFDGENVPIFKRQIIRERALKRHIDEITTENESRQKMLEDLAKNLNEAGNHSSEGESDLFQSPIKRKKKRATATKSSEMSDDLDNLYSLPSSSSYMSQPTNREESTEDILEFEYDTLDNEIEALKQTRQAVRKERLHIKQIPSSSDEFCTFQMKRLLQRSEIQRQIETLQLRRLKNQVHDIVPLQSKKVYGITDPTLKIHYLAQNLDDDEIQVIDESNNADISSNSKTSCSLSYVDKRNSKNSWKELLNERKGTTTRSIDEKEDNDLQQAIFLSLLEAPSAAMNRLPQESIESLNRIEHFSPAINNGNESGSSSDDDDFIDVPNYFDDELQDGNRKENDQEDMYSTENADESESEKSVEIIEQNEVSTDDDGELFRPKTTQNDYGEKQSPNDSIYSDCQKLLDILGLPYMKAPGEAEAQCVCLEKLKLVDGIVSDDSDVWPFGASLVYRHMFSRRQHVQEYDAKTIQRHFGLTRAEFIQFVMLSGGDYTKGLAKIGPTAALELIAEFIQTQELEVVNPPNSSNILTPNDSHLNKVFHRLQRIRDWILSNDSHLENDDTNLLERAQKNRLQHSLRNSNDPETLNSFPDAGVFKAYASPLVDNLSKQFKWDRIEFNHLNAFLNEKLGIDADMVNKVSLIYSLILTRLGNGILRWEMESVIGSDKMVKKIGGLVFR